MGVWKRLLTSPPRAAGLSQPHLPRAKTSLSSPQLPEEMTLVGSEISVGWDAENLEALLKPGWRLGKGMGMGNSLFASAAPSQGCEMVEDGEHPLTQLAVSPQTVLVTPNPPSLACLQQRRKTTSRKPRLGQM